MDLLKYVYRTYPNFLSRFEIKQEETTSFKVIRMGYCVICNEEHYPENIYLSHEPGLVCGTKKLLFKGEQTIISTEEKTSSVSLEDPSSSSGKQLSDIIFLLLDSNVYYNVVTGEKNINPHYSLCLENYSLCVSSRSELNLLKEHFINLDLIELEEVRDQRRLEFLITDSLPEEPNIKLKEWLAEFQNKPYEAEGIEEYYKNILNKTKLVLNLNYWYDYKLDKYTEEEGSFGLTTKEDKLFLVYKEYFTRNPKKINSLRSENRKLLFNIISSVEEGYYITVKAGEDISYVRTSLSELPSCYDLEEVRKNKLLKEQFNNPFLRWLESKKVSIPQAKTKVEIKYIWDFLSVYLDIKLNPGIDFRNFGNKKIGIAVDKYLWAAIGEAMRYVSKQEEVVLIGCNMSEEKETQLAVAKSVKVNLVCWEDLSEKLNVSREERIKILKEWL